MEHKIEGVIVRVTPYKDNDAIINLLSKEGLISFKARGILKITSKNAKLCQLYTHGEYYLNQKQENGYYLLISGKIVSYPYEAFCNFNFNSLFAFVCEAILRTEEHQQGYELLIFLHLISEQKVNYLNIVLIIFRYIFSWNGISLQVDECIGCGSSKNIIAINYNHGGFICSKCYEDAKGSRLSISQLKQIRQIVKANISNYNDLEIEEEFGYQLVNQFFHYVIDHCGITFKSKEVLMLSLKS